MGEIVAEPLLVMVFVSSGLPLRRHLPCHKSAAETTVCMVKFLLVRENGELDWSLVADEAMAEEDPKNRCTASTVISTKAWLLTASDGSVPLAPHVPG